MRYLLFSLLLAPFGRSFKDAARRKWDERNGIRVRTFILKYQGLFIKFGQFAGIFRSILREEFILPLESLQDQVAPQPFDIMAVQLKSSLGDNYYRHFVEIESQAIAAASIGQVHRARIRRGDKVVSVAVKILYPYIEELVRLDLRIIRRIFQVIQVLLPNFQGNVVYEQIAAIVLEETDLRNEASNLEKIRTNFQHESYVFIPKMYSHLSDKHIMVTQFVEHGIKITDIETIRRHGIDPEKVADLLIRAYAKQIFKHRFYHADPHPGNLFIVPGPKIAFIDFGACQSMTQENRDAFRKIIRASMARDYYKVIEGLEDLGAVPKTKDIAVLETTVAYVIEKIRRMEKEHRTFESMTFAEMSGLEDMRRLRKYNIGLNDLMTAFIVPQGWVALERVVAHILSITMSLAPQKTLGQLTKSYLSNLILDDYQDLKRLVNEQSKTFAYNVVDMPMNINKLINQWQRGRGEVNIHNFENRMTEVIGSQRQIVWAIFFGIFASLSYFAYRGGELWFFVNMKLLAIFCLIGTLRVFFSFRKRAKRFFRNLY